MDKIYDSIIIGAGPAGLNAALYLARAGKKCIFIDKDAPGGKMTKTYKVENWIGTEEIIGAKLALEMFNHAKKSGAEYKYGEVESIISEENYKKQIILKSGEILITKTIIIASGMKNNVPINIKNFETYENKGISYCVICDGPFYKDKPQAIIGGGNSAIEESIFLSSIASEVYVFVREDKMIAEEKIIERMKEKNNIKYFLNSSVLSVEGNGEKIEKILANVNGTKQEFIVNSIFPYIGFSPANNFISNKKLLDEKGFLVTDENMQTKEKGIYAIGDIRQKEVRQIITAASDGAIAAKHITKVT